MIIKLDFNAMRKGILTGLMLISIGGSSHGHASYIFDQNTTKLAVNTVIAIGLGCGICKLGYEAYNLYEVHALNKFCNRLANNETTSINIMNHERNTIFLDDQQLVNGYARRMDDYVALCRNVADDKISLLAIQGITNHDISAWKNNAKAIDVIQKAEQFAHDNADRLHTITMRCSFLHERKALIALAHLVATENQSYFENLITTVRNQGSISESIVRTCYPNCAWPLRKAWQEIEKRKHEYMQLLPKVNAYADISIGSCSQKYVELANVIIKEYAHTQSLIAGFSAYTDDLRIEKEFELKEELARQERIKAEAMKKSADAQQRQAYAQEEQNINAKEKELALCRKQLSEVKRRISRGDTNYYLLQEKYQLQDRIRDLKIELYGSWSIFQSFFEVLIDQD